MPFGLVGVVGLLGSWVVAEPAGGAPAEAEDAARVKAQLRVALNARGPAFDACTARYLREYPEAKGVAKLDLEVGPDGRVVRATAETRLVGARNLRPCLEGVVEGLRFPVSRKSGPGRLSLDVPVEKGARFRLWGPDERRPEPETQRVETLIRFLPGDWSLAGPKP